MTPCNHLPVNFDRQADLTTGSHFCNDIAEELIRFLCKPHKSLTRAQKRSGQYIVDMFKYDLEKQVGGDADSDIIDWLQDPKYNLQSVSENLDDFFFAGNLRGHVSYIFDDNMQDYVGLMKPAMKVEGQRWAMIKICPQVKISERTRRRLHVVLTILHEQTHALLYLMPCECAFNTGRRVDMVGLGHGRTFTKILANIRGSFTSEFYLLLNSKFPLSQSDFISLDTVKISHVSEWSTMVKVLGDLEPFLNLMQEIGLYEVARRQDNDPVEWHPIENSLVQRIGGLSYECEDIQWYNRWLLRKRALSVGEIDYNLVYQRWKVDEEAMDMFKRTGATLKMRTYLSANRPSVRLRSLENFLTSISRRQVLDQATKITGETIPWKPLLRSELSKIENPPDRVYTEGGLARVQEDCEVFAYLERADMYRLLDNVLRRIFILSPGTLLPAIGVIE